MGVTTVFNSLILGGWVTKVLKNGEKKGGGRVGDNNILTFFVLKCHFPAYSYSRLFAYALRNCILGNFDFFVLKCHFPAYSYTRLFAYTLRNCILGNFVCSYL